MKQTRACNGCHTAWSPDTFDHAVTGQPLNATHTSFDCEDCHADRQFDAAPTCDSCHDEEEGIAFPARRPGPPGAAGSLPGNGELRIGTQ